MTLPWLLLLLVVTQCGGSQDTGHMSEDDGGHNLFGRPEEGYCLHVDVGTPPQRFAVLVDTGSSNFAVAAVDSPEISTYFVAANSSTYIDKRTEVSVPYTQGYWVGHLGTDLVSVPSLPLPRVQCDLSSITSVHNFYMNNSLWEGILGIAYSTISRPDSTVASWIDTSGVTIFEMKLCGATAENHHSGTFQVGSSVHGGGLATPIVREWFYEITLTGLSVGGKRLEISCMEYNKDKSIVDSGTSNLRLPKVVFQAVVDTLIKFVDVDHAFLYGETAICTNDFLTPFPNITIYLSHGEKSEFGLEITPKSYVRRSYGHDSDNPCFKFGIDSSDTGTVLGVVLMEGFEVTFNRSGKHIQFKEAEDCGPPVGLHGPQDTFATSTCIFNAPKATSMLTVAAYVLLGLSCVCTLPLLYLLGEWTWTNHIKRRFKRKDSSTSLVSSP